jgi:hypothetical protein
MVREFIDKEGVKHFDDQTIEDDEGFLRRFEGDYWHKEQNRLSSSAFGPEGISFSLESLISPGEFHSFFPQQGLFKLKAIQLRGEDEVLERDPCGDQPWEQAHALSWGKRSNTKKNKTKKKKFSQMAEILFSYPS